MLLHRTRFGVIASLSTALVLLATNAASAAPPPQQRKFALPMPAITAPAEAYGAYVGQSTCLNGATPGVLSFEKMVLARYPGSRNLGITRGCGQGGRSEHKEGRAWDWGVRVDRPTEKAYAEDVIGWLLATDASGVRAANARRLGIMYMIWNRQIWSSSRAADGWRSYFGPNPHVDHVHLSWTWPGAEKLTSYWTGTPYGIGAGGGRLDSLWGSAGWLPIQPSDSLRLINTLRWSDGRLWNVSQSTVSAEVIVEERLPSGGVGSAFGGPGRVRVPIPVNTAISSAVLTSTGSIVLAGTTLPPVAALIRPPAPVPVPIPGAPITPAPVAPVLPPTPDLFAMRVTAAGLADTTFGIGGMVSWDLGGEESVGAVATIGTDIVLAGSSIVAGVQSLAVARLTSAGTPAAFGTGGVFLPPAASTAAGTLAANSVLPRPDGSMLVGCRRATETCVAKLTPAGLLEPTWGAAGVTGLSPMPGTAVLAAGPANTVYATFPQPNGYAGIYRLNAIGLGDPTFGTGQYWLQNYGPLGCSSRPTAMTVRSDGTPVIAGALDGCGKGFVARLTIDGPQDPTWGESGVATFDTVAGQPVGDPVSVSLQSDGHVLVVAAGGAGTSVAPSIGRFTTIGPVPARTVAVGSASTALFGQSVQLTAVVRSSSTNALATGVPVTFEARTAGTAGWSTVGSVASTSGGVAVLAVQPVTRASYRARSGATELLLAATSDPLDVRVGYALTTSVAGPVAPAKLYPRQAVTLSLLAKPARPGRRVWLQRFDKGRWRTVARPLLDARSSARVKVASAAPTTGRFRWVIFPDAQYDGATTSTVSVVWNARPAPPKKVPPVKPKPGTPTKPGTPLAPAATPPPPPNAAAPPAAPGTPAPTAPAPTVPPAVAVPPAAPANPPVVSPPPVE